MKKYLKLLAAMSLALGMGACSSAADSGADSSEDKKEETTQETEVAEDEAPAEALGGSYTIHVQGDDWGTGVDKVILKLDAEVDAVEKDAFKVVETKSNIDWTSEDTPVVVVDADREVTDAWLSDENGEKVDGPSEYVTLELYISPNDGSAFIWNPATQFNTWCDPYELTISLNDGKSLGDATALNISGAPASQSTNGDMFEEGSFTSSDGFDMNYGLFVPEEESTTLFVWLHGMGEGGSAMVEGTDYLVPILANEVTAYASDEFQEILGGANVLVPQSPTFWMDTNGDPEATPGNADGTSVYTASVHELIDKIKEETGSEKVVIAGCSNGGYMTVNLAMNYGDEYTAYVPICEAINDTDITDEQIQAMASLPMYFIWSDDDDTVDPSAHEIPTVQRLLDAGAQNVHKATVEHVTDTSGRFKDENGDPHMYSGHWSWVVFDNNESVTEDGISAWQWIADQLK